MKIVGVSDRNLRVGEDHQNARLTDREVELVRQLHAQGLGYTRIAQVMGCGRTTVAQICRYERRVTPPVRWRSVKGVRVPRP